MMDSEKTYQKTRVGAGSPERSRIVVGVSGASGVGLALTFLKELRKVPDKEIHLVVSEGALRVFRIECGIGREALEPLADRIYSDDELGAAIASGSFETEGMAVIPCSMKTLAGIASGYAENLLQRAADVTLKEGRPLVLVPREMPMHLGHLENLVKAARYGAKIVPPVLTYYNGPRTVEDMERHIAHKVLGLFGIRPEGMRRWTGEPVCAADS